MILLLDNYDSFSYNLFDYLRVAGMEVELVRNSKPPPVSLTHYSGLVISPGPGTPRKANFLHKYLNLAVGNIPVLGICLGHQAIVEHFGGQIELAEKPMHGKISKVALERDTLFVGLPDTIEVVRYHSLIAKTLPSALRSIAQSESGEIMAIRHESLPVWGLQFHPEAALTQFGHEMLENWAGQSLKPGWELSVK